VSESVESGQIRHIIAAQPRDDGIYMVLTMYWESDPAAAVGQVISMSWEREGDFNCALNTNDSLNPLWASPAGNLWVGSANGNIWTTAPVGWRTPPEFDVDFTIEEPSLPWLVTTLPPPSGRKFPPNLTAIWGSADDDVHVGTFSGAIYHFDGKAWAQSSSEVSTCLHEIHGSARDHVFCVGEEGVVLHFDGRAWRRVPFPGDAGSREGLTGVRVMGEKDILICSRSGKLLHGSHHGLEILLDHAGSFYGVGHFKGRNFLAAGNGGVWELIGNRLVQLKDNFGAVGVFEARELLCFVEPTQNPAALIEYDPREPDPWWERGFPI
jgi:hypothetical protein